MLKLSTSIRVWFLNILLLAVYVIEARKQLGINYSLQYCHYNPSNWQDNDINISDHSSLILGCLPATFITQRKTSVVLLTNDTIVSKSYSLPMITSLNRNYNNTNNTLHVLEESVTNNVQKIDYSSAILANYSFATISPGTSPTSLTIVRKSRTDGINFTGYRWKKRSLCAALKKNEDLQEEGINAAKTLLDYENSDLVNHIDDSFYPESIETHVRVKRDGSYDDRVNYLKDPADFFPHSSSDDVLSITNGVTKTFDESVPSTNSVEEKSPSEIKTIQLPESKELSQNEIRTNNDDERVPISVESCNRNSNEQSKDPNSRDLSNTENAQPPLKISRTKRDNRNQPMYAQKKERTRRRGASMSLRNKLHSETSHRIKKTPGKNIRHGKNVRKKKKRKRKKSHREHKGKKIKRGEDVHVNPYRDSKAKLADRFVTQRKQRDNIIRNSNKIRSFNKDPLRRSIGAHNEDNNNDNCALSRVEPHSNSIGEHKLEWPNGNHGGQEKESLTSSDEKKNIEDEIDLMQMRNRRNNEKRENSEESGISVDGMKSRRKRNKDTQESLNSQANDSSELMYYEEIREPETEIKSDQCSQQNEKQPSESGQLRDSRAAKSIDQVKELTEKLIVKVNELQNYLSNGSVKENEGGDRMIKTCEIDDMCSNVSTVCAILEQTPKIVQRCAPSSTTEFTTSNSIAENGVDLGGNIDKNDALRNEKKRLAVQKGVIGSSNGSHLNKKRVMTKRKGLKWGRWTDWSSCSVTCGKGRQIRWRYCLHDCTTAETEMEEKACQLPACPPGKFLGLF